MAEPGVRSGELFAAPSLATDLGTGQPPEHALRTCLLAVGLSQLAGLDDAERADAYYLALSHSIGCTADAHEAALLFGDDLAPRADYALIDPARPPEMIAFLWRRVAQGAPPIRRVRALATAVAAGRAHARQSFTSHCEVGRRLTGGAAAPLLHRARACPRRGPGGARHRPLPHRLHHVE